MRLVLKNSKLVFGKVQYVSLATFQKGSLSAIYGGVIYSDPLYPNCATSTAFMVFDTDVVLSTTNYEFCVWVKKDPNLADETENYSRDGYEYSTLDKTIPAGSKFCIVVRTGEDTSVLVDLEEANSCITGREAL